MLAIGRALMCAPRLLLLDEPSLGLAPRVVEAVFELITTLRDQDVTIFLVEQNVAGALEIADRAYMMASGAIVSHGDAARMRQEGAAADAFPGPAEMELVFQQTVNAIALGGTYALLALGLAVVFSIMGLINFAHGELMTIAGYVLMACGLAGVPFGLAVPLAMLASMAAAMVMERIAFRPVRGASAATMLVTSFAVAMILQVLFQNLISARSQAVAIPDFLGDSVRIAGLVIGVNKLFAIGGTLVLLVALERFMTRQKQGIAMRAAAEDFAVARLMGIRANTVISAAFALSGLLAGAAAVLWVSQRASVDPLMGFTPVLKAFIAAILGGLGSLRGAVAGGFVLGFIEVFLAAFLPTAWQEFREPIGLSLVVLLLVARPKGLIPAATLRAQKV